jgi:hypothetical protein
MGQGHLDPLITTHKISLFQLIIRVVMAIRVLIFSIRGMVRVRVRVRDAP